MLFNSNGLVRNVKTGRANKNLETHHYIVSRGKEETKKRHRAWSPQPYIYLVRVALRLHTSNDIIIIILVVATGLMPLTAAPHTYHRGHTLDIDIYGLATHDTQL